MRKRLAACLGSLTMLWALGPGEVLALDVPLTVRNPEQSARSAEPVTSGVPFAQGVLTSAGSVRVLRGPEEIPGQFRVTARWPDGSVRWLLCDFQVDLDAGGTSSVALQAGRAPAPVAGMTVDDQAATLTVDTGSASFTFHKSELAVRGNFFTAIHDGRVYTAVPQSWTIEESGPLKVVVRVDGGWFSAGSPLRDAWIGFRARLSFHRGKSEARVALTFRNNHSFGWSYGLNAQPDLIVTGLQFGVPLLPAGGSYAFGSGVEKTFHAVVSASGAVSVRESRYNGDGTVAAGHVAERPLAVALPSYYASTGAWGCIVPPLRGLPADRQADVERFEKLQRAKVDPADLEDPTNMTGITAFQHLVQDLPSWHDYGDLRWGGSWGPWSGNHYDWSFGMYLHFMRTGRLPFANLARVMARHEIDLDIYHTRRDDPAFNCEKNWESRPSHDNPGNLFGGGRPSHSWFQGYALHWLLTGDPRGRDAVEDLAEGVRQYVYESFNGEGYIDTNEIRTAGWLAENLVTLWRLDPQMEIQTTLYGVKTIPEAIQDVFRSVFDREAAAGGAGFVYGGDSTWPDPDLRHPLMNCYFLEPAAKAYEEVFRGRDDAYAAQLLSLVERMTRFLMNVTYGGDTNAGGLYRPLQIPYLVDVSGPDGEGQIPYLLMAANAAGFCYCHGGGTEFLRYAHRAFRDYVRYLGVAGPDEYVDPALRTPTCYNSSVYVETESKVHGWSSRYGMYYFRAAEQEARAGLPCAAPLLLLLR